MPQVCRLPPYLLSDGKEGTILILRIIPGAKKDQVEGLHGDALKLRITAPPVDGKANKQLLKFLAKALGLRSRDLEIIGGAKGRNKRIHIHAIRPEKALAQLEKFTA
jgi:uncharacterized protein (TIGR00251 family)